MDQRVAGWFDVADGARGEVAVDRATEGWGLRACEGLVRPHGPFLTKVIKNCRSTGDLGDQDSRHVGSDRSQGRGDEPFDLGDESLGRDRFRDVPVEATR
jgi:hypothetical protein